MTHDERIFMWAELKRLEGSLNNLGGIIQNESTPTPETIKEWNTILNTFEVGFTVWEANMKTLLK